MRCPKCNSVCIRVLNTRDAPKNEVRRNRICTVCKYRFTTYELTATSKSILERDAKVKNG